MELHFTRTNGPADEAIDQLIKRIGGIYHPEIVREMILAALKAGQEDVNKADLKFMNSTLKEMRFTVKVFSPYRHVKKITVFGSARTKSDEPIYEMARLFGKKLVQSGYMVITGGGPGIMQAVNEGAGPENSFGVNIRLPFEQKPNYVLQGNPRYIMYKYFFNRKVAFIKEANAIVLFPGGFGTLDEAMETLTLLQTGKRDPMPLILVDEPGGSYWSQWLKFFKKELLAHGYISGTDFDLFERVESADDALAKIDHFYRRYHSMRFVGEKLVIRLSSAIDPSRVMELKGRFSDILSPRGGLSLSGPLPAEADEPEIAHLPRLVVDFNRKDFSRLRSLIDVVNNG
ncbi:MAG: TIGR00730 family Rossman fold protein [Nitrospirae bacterium CG_4_9_14_3_um_filter_53_35]|nr:MAG: Rossman fold protein, TIGR00730 family [Nitrospirae bacterium CG2_30_53_67]PIS36258.1 MAG: TIGR00730 family Rossman fold protein [Nitrospirae bacterium CG08_land_8_20_14_0_20_52_24]PIW85894.1 MAG: TIGR00730 family Rossman fold protein [Nitrospirae bacterium CG_4_8_14_3_um_filter_50_41]PIX85410.1 MAG: TIGR00730 family Rossman fold protein [Nitrospirae bacterium CG_4_10_14_3_um_filter_53_41]PJA76529.1 MAG: TIGR00730 family Rossman fold protein [Nitrospirae bacterium CG_4_9_14_3_um_filter_